MKKEKRNSEEEKKFDVQNPEIAENLLRTAIHTRVWKKRGDTDTIMSYAFHGEDPKIKAEAIGYFAYMIDHFETHNIDDGDIMIIKDKIPSWLENSSPGIRKSAEFVARALEAREMRMKPKEAIDKKTGKSTLKKIIKKFLGTSMCPLFFYSKILLYSHRNVHSRNPIAGFRLKMDYILNKI